MPCRRRRAHRRRTGRAASCASTSKRSTATSTRSRATRCSARPASACSTASARCWTAMPPYQGGGDMILTVTFERSTYNALPYKFEAGTPNITGVVGLGAAIDYLERIDFAARRRARACAARLRHRAACSTDVPGARLIGTAADKAGVLSFVVDGIHAHDLGTDRRPRRRRDPHGPSLRHARHGAFRRSGNGARIVRLLQQSGRRRPADRRPAGAPWRFSVDELQDLYRRSDPRSQPQPA